LFFLLALLFLLLFLLCCSALLPCCLSLPPCCSRCHTLLLSRPTLLFVPCCSYFHALLLVLITHTLLFLFLRLAIHTLLLTPCYLAAFTLAPYCSCFYTLLLSLSCPATRALLSLPCYSCMATCTLMFCHHALLFYLVDRCALLPCHCALVFCLASC